jgi:diguanylate cyclase (GGDEF)-like protein
MTPGCNSIDTCLRRLPDLVLVVLALAIIAALTVFKLSIGQSISLIDFLFIPVVGVGWFARRRWLGYLIALIAATDTVVVAIVAESHASLGAALASGLARFVLYLVVLSLLGMMRKERAGDQRAASVDALTGAANSRAFDSAARQEIERAQRYGGRLSLACIDVDDFKAVNDALGHDAGDRVLSQVGHVLRSSVRSVDVVARTGGDEFAILMPETGVKAADEVLRRVRGELGRVRLRDGSPVGFSLGLITFDTPPSSVAEMTVAADELMYRAKVDGKNRVSRGRRRGSYVPQSLPAR